MWVKTKQSPVSLFIFLLLVNMQYFFPQFSNANEHIHSPHFAGSWYPAEEHSLNKMLSNYLHEGSSQLANRAKDEHVGKNVLAIIAPHAGYQYSGQTAAFAYSTLLDSKYKRVFLLGPSHHVAFTGAVLPSQSIFETPIGKIEIDKVTVNKLLQLPGFQQMDQVFDIEHSLELQLPWIYKTLPKVKLIPMVIGNVDRDTIAEIATSLKKELGPGDLVIISSDFTHYGPRFDYQPFSDETTETGLKNRIAELDKEAFNYLKQLDHDELLDFYQRSHDTICGIYPCAILLSILPSDAQTKLLNYRTSADITKDDQSNSVSYMAIAFSAPGWTSRPKAGALKENSQAPLSLAEGQILLKIARQSIFDHLSGNRKDPSVYEKQLSPYQIERFKEHCGVFVTLYEKQQQLSASNQSLHKQLRGCIGYIYPTKSLLEAVCENAINAACNDPRFSPVVSDELDNLDLEINILTKPAIISSWEDIKLGQDGVILKKGDRQAVFLPKVATEFGWDLPQTLGELSVKAGLSPDAWRQGSQFEVFQSQIFD